jgi:hypothetical protein
MQCPNCKFDNPVGVKFCNNCGKPMPQEPPVAPTGENQQLPMIGAGLGLSAGLLGLLGWFGSWTAAGFGNGPQFVILPFGLGKASGILQSASGAADLFSLGALSGVSGQVKDLMGLAILVSVLAAVASVALAYLIVVTLWAGIQCLEARGEPQLPGSMQARFGKFRRFGLWGIGISLALMVVISILGATAIGSGLYTMAFAFAAEFLAVVYLKPRLR